MKSSKSRPSGEASVIAKHVEVDAGSGSLHMNAENEKSNEEQLETSIVLDIPH